MIKFGNIKSDLEIYTMLFRWIFMLCIVYLYYIAHVYICDNDRRDVSMCPCLLGGRSLNRNMTVVVSQGELGERRQ